MKFLISTCLLLVAVCAHSTPNKYIALTLDDSPRAASGYFDGPTRANKLIAALKAHDVAQAAFFSVSAHLNQEGITRLNAYSDAGHLIANHTHDHPDFNTLTLAQYIANFEQADRELSQFKTMTKLFRFPYLREGDTVEKRDGMRAALAAKGYRNGYVTVNTYDWFIENQFQKAIKDGVKVDLIRMSHYYVDMMVQSIEAYDELAIKELGRSPKHVLLLHEMDITALFLGDLIAELKRKGWIIISPLTAYEDEIATFQTTEVLPYNPGRIGEIARANGQTKGLWPQALQESYLDQQFEQQVMQVVAPK
ncbi:polysaccharide deacetylase family protein [Pseudoalteromonas tunicata]|uniref:polysaccharide deacetylase family protein n=1 Tax=Pseudoalteromonas tunicata TaxID=314281 RepID=UPI00273E8575|nr:polysaccharide deacetylase family protein [Pseudoalteromonas tunicata]MDP5212290.1 polysaccharide deacetylase family protein [Pseudoalteromonas tunicata]